MWPAKLDVESTPNLHVEHVQFVVKQQLAKRVKTAVGRRRRGGAEALGLCSLWSEAAAWRRNMRLIRRADAALRSVRSPGLIMDV